MRWLRFLLPMTSHRIFCFTLYRDRLRESKSSRTDCSCFTIVASVESKKSPTYWQCLIYVFTDKSNLGPGPEAKGAFCLVPRIKRPRFGRMNKYDSTFKKKRPRHCFNMVVNTSWHEGRREKTNPRQCANLKIFAKPFPSLLTCFFQNSSRIASRNSSK